jgi:hypothetical protein
VWSSSTGGSHARVEREAFGDTTTELYPTHCQMVIIALSECLSREDRRTCVGLMALSSDALDEIEEYECCEDNSVGNKMERIRIVEGRSLNMAQEVCETRHQ